jgi:WD40 repeat protein
MSDSYLELQPSDRLVPLGGTMPTWDIVDKVEIPRGGSINSVTWDTAGQHLFSCGKDQAIRVYRFESSLIHFWEAQKAHAG